MREPSEKPSRSQDDLATRVGSQASRRLRARRGNGVWFGLGMMGLIGWSVVVPTLVGAIPGNWLDGRQVGDRSWTLALLVAGLVVGCANAWHWVKKEDKAMHEDEGNDDE